MSSRPATSRGWRTPAIGTGCSTGQIVSWRSLIARPISQRRGSGTTRPTPKTSPAHTQLRTLGTSSITILGMPETWKDVVGFEGKYQVSDLGRVKSLPRVDCGGYHRTGRILSLIDETSGHKQVCLSDGSRTKRGRVHLLVLEAFVGPRPPRHVARHWPDRNPGNNQLSNLSWSTSSQNMLDRREHGTDHQLQKTHCPRGHQLHPSNLVASSLPRRDCLACSRARASIRRHGGSLQEVSDRYFAG